MAASTNLTPEQRSDRARAAHLTSAVNTVVRRWEALSEPQKAAIRTAAALR